MMPAERLPAGDADTRHTLPEMESSAAAARSAILRKDTFSLSFNSVRKAEKHYRR
jgi:hypothetical protein